MRSKPTKKSKQPTRQYIVGIDIGGTFTDAYVSTVEGTEAWTGKSPTTPADLAEGLVGALEAVAGEIGVAVTELLGNTVKFAHGTTVVTNVIAQMKGAKVGLVTTRGCRDIMTVARSARAYEFDFLKHQPLPDLVERTCIIEVPERVDCKGVVIAPLQEDGLPAAIQRLVEEERVEAIAVCFLWSFRHPEHERRVRAMINQMYPDLYVSISSDIHPVMREYERMITTVLNSYAGKVFVAYCEKVDRVLRELGLKCRLLMMSSAGGALSAQEAAHRPIALAYSGPAGGLLGATTISGRLGIPNLLNTDMGGTSYDVSLVVNGRPLTRNKAKIGPFWTGLSVMDIEAIGAGGGSIAWVDGRGMVQVGPQSAGASPGPACYGNGGRRPTVSDAAVMLGILDPDYFLGGKIKLNSALAEEALVAEVGGRIGQGARDTAAGIFRVVASNMANAVRHVTIGRGLDPRDFAMLSYGGCGPMFAASIARELAIPRVLVPEISSVFSAYGAARTDIRRDRYRTLRQPVPPLLPAVNNVFVELAQEVHSDLERDGVSPENVELSYEGDFQYEGQVSPFNVPLPVPPFTDEDVAGFKARFEAEYERLLGAGTAVSSMPVELVNCRVVGYGRTLQPDTVKHTIKDHQVSSAAAGRTRRTVYLPYERREVEISVLNAAEMTSGGSLEGPALIERDDTTVFLPENTTTRMDASRNIIIELR